MLFRSTNRQRLRVTFSQGVSIWLRFWMDRDFRRDTEKERQRERDREREGDRERETEGNGRSKVVLTVTRERERMTWEVCVCG